eukprot:3426125-Amphidinium_carterae.1
MPSRRANGVKQRAKEKTTMARGGKEGERQVPNRKRRQRKADSTVPWLLPQVAASAANGDIKR